MRNFLLSSYIKFIHSKQQYRPWLVKIDYDHSGVKHWFIERGTSVGTLCLLGTAFVYPCQAVDHALGVMLPIHCHVGFDSIITDYVPRYKYPFSNKILFYMLYGLTGTTLYGLYKFNSEDIGLSQFLKKMYTRSHQ